LNCFFVSDTAVNGIRMLDLTGSFTTPLGRDRND
jgi:hypothetical protein